MMDRRLWERRRRVAEERARTNLGRLLRALVVLGAVAGAVWFAQSPFLSVAAVAVEGADRVDVGAVVRSVGVREGRPMLLVDVSGAEAALMADPWVAEATVVRDWPQRVVVEVVERVPEALVELSHGVWLAAGDGTLLEEVSVAPSGLGQALFAHLAPREAAESLEVAGAVEFLAALPPDYRDGARVELGEEGLEGQVAGFRLRLGRPFDMRAKAAVAVAVIQAGVEEGSVITVMAPASPAVLPPQAVPNSTVPSTTP